MSRLVPAGRLCCRPEPQDPQLPTPSKAGPSGPKTKAWRPCSIYFYDDNNHHNSNNDNNNHHKNDYWYHCVLLQKPIVLIALALGRLGSGSGIHSGALVAKMKQILLVVRATGKTSGRHKGHGFYMTARIAAIICPLYRTPGPS